MLGEAPSAGSWDEASEGGARDAGPLDLIASALDLILSRTSIDVREREFRRAQLGVQFRGLPCNKRMRERRDDAGTTAHEQPRPVVRSFKLAFEKLCTPIQWTRTTERELAIGDIYKIGNPFGGTAQVLSINKNKKRGL